VACPEGKLLLPALRGSMARRGTSDDYGPEEWDRNLAVPCLTMITNIRCGDWRAPCVGRRRMHYGRPLTASRKMQCYTAARVFFADLQEWVVVRQNFSRGPTCCRRIPRIPREPSLSGHPVTLIDAWQASTHFERSGASATMILAVESRIASCRK
jgi:hypothetical protein